ncbi:MAG: putative DNA binding domain-containing protein [Legionella sp.]|nr:putative DNA binding domain-containing protein [Legionella sp.]
MNIEQLNKLISKGESHQLEFKKSTGQLKPAFESLCAFLNEAGGTILIGITDKGKIAGQQVNDKTQQEIAREISKIEPKTSLNVHYIDVDENKQVIVIKCSAGKHIPYTYDGRSYERNQSTTERMSQHRYEQLIIRRGQLNHKWDSYTENDLTIKDLDQEEIRRTIKEGVDINRRSTEALTFNIEQILRNFKLIEHGKLTNAAVVLYAKDPTAIFSHCMIRLARFRGKDKVGDFIDNLQVHGNAFQLIKAAVDFSIRHLPIAGYFEPGKLQRIDQPAVPALAIREALINAICHRDYMVENATISLAIYDDRLEIWNIGELPPELDIESLKVPHDSYPRNQKIADVFYKRGWIENWGTGTLRMMGYCQNNKTPEPEFAQYKSGFAVIFRFKEAMNTAVTITPPSDFTPRQMEIIAVLKNVEEMSLRDIMDHLQLKPAERTLRKDLNYLKNAGIINSQGQARFTTWYFIKN